MCIYVQFCIQHVHANKGTSNLNIIIANSLTVIGYRFISPFKKSNPT